MGKKAKNKVTVVVTELAKPNLTMGSTPPNCPLCYNPDTQLWHQDTVRPYYRCAICDLTFVPSNYHLSHSDEKAIYDLHENNPEDQGYRKFLSRLTTPLIQKLKHGDAGLDFGCGPGPALATMMVEQGFQMEVFDIYYANNSEALEREYDFVTSTEVIEHLSKPSDVFEQLLSLIKPGGFLGLMTKRTPKSLEKFRAWHYIKDPTHISFYSDRTFKFLAKKYNCSLELPGPDTALLKKLAT